MLHTKTPFRTLIKYGGSYGLIAWNIFGIIFGNLRDIACLIALAGATNAVLNGEGVVSAVIFAAFAMFINSPIIALKNYMSNKYHLNFTKKVKTGLARHVASLPLSYIEEQNSASLISTYSADTEIVLKWIFRDLFGIIGIAVYILGIFLYSLTQNVLLTVIVFPVILIIAPLFSGIYKKMTEVTQVQRKSAADALVKMQEIFNDPEFVKTYTLEEKMDNRMGIALKTRRDAEKKSGIYQGVTMALGMLTSYMPAFVAAAAGIYFLGLGLISPGFLVGFVQIVIQRLSGTVMQVNGIFTSTKRASVSADRIVSILNVELERSDGMVPVPKNDCCFSFEKVDFSYSNGNEVLKNISFESHKGERIGIVGRSGCGKSTILKLIMGLYDVTGGRILFYGHDINKIAPEYLRRQIAPVFQNTNIFPLSIRENIGMVAENVTDKDIMSALEKAGLKEFIQSTPDGLGTVVGERGVTLSGGQRQRVSIARAFLSDAPILLFDEPTSALDAATELVFQETLNNLLQGKTTVTVAHRLSTISGCDRIYVVDNKEIVQCGTHEELIKQDGVYHTLYKEQLEGGASNVS